MILIWSQKVYEKLFRKPFESRLIARFPEEAGIAVGCVMIYEILDRS